MAATNALAMYRGTLKGKNPEGIASIAMTDSVSAFIEAETVSDALRELSINFEGLQFDFGKAEDDIFYTDPPFF